MSLETPAQDAAGVAPVPVATAPRAYFTYGLIALLLIIFGIEMILNGAPLGPQWSPSLQTLYLLGAADRQAVVDLAQWWRLLTAPLLHANIFHVTLNCLALFLVARLVEPVVGWRWVAATFTVSAVSGAALSIALNPRDTISVGASGGIVGIFMLAIFAGTRVARGDLRTRLILRATYGAVPAILPFLNAQSSDGMQIDYGAHIGGAIGGLIVVGVLAFVMWPRGTPRAKGGPVAAGVAALYFVAAALAVFPIAGLMGASPPFDPSPPVDESSKPPDPSELLKQGLAELRAGDVGMANAELEHAYIDVQGDGSVDPVVATNIEALLAVTEYVDGNNVRAKKLAKPTCATETSGLYANMLRQDGLCP